MEVMVIVMDILEKFPASVSSVKAGLEEALENWISSHPGAEALNIKVDVDFLAKLQGRKRVMRCRFNDPSFVEVVFQVEKKMIMKKLGDNIKADAKNTIEEL